jgi:hypothetical protein
MCWRSDLRTAFGSKAVASVSALRRSRGLRATLGPFMVFGLLAMPAWSPVSAETSKAPKEKFVEQEVTGTVVAYTKRALSVEVGRTEKTINEMLFPVDPTVTKFDQLSGITDLQAGDQVKVRYRQKHQQNQDGSWTLKGTVATRISRQGRSLSSPRLKTDGGGS